MTSYSLEGPPPNTTSSINESCNFVESLNKSCSYEGLFSIDFLAFLFVLASILILISLYLHRKRGWAKKRSSLVTVLPLILLFAFLIELDGLVTEPDNSHIEEPNWNAYTFNLEVSYRNTEYNSTSFVFESRNDLTINLSNMSFYYKTDLGSKFTASNHLDSKWKTQAPYDNCLNNTHESKQIIKTGEMVSCNSSVRFPEKGEEILVKLSHRGWDYNKTYRCAVERQEARTCDLTYLRSSQ